MRLRPRALAALALCFATAALAQRTVSVPADYRLGAFALPDPGGRPIGTTTFDAGAAERPLYVTAWYPARSTAGTPAPYLSPDEQRVQAAALDRNFLWPSSMLDAVVKLPTHALRDVPIARGRFPVVIYSHGFFLYPRQNTALMEALAARGYLVFSLAHPGDAADLPGPRGPIRTAPVVATKPDEAPLKAFWAARDHAARAAAFPRFWQAFATQRMRDSLVRWRTDIIALADHVTSRSGPPALAALLRSADPRRLAFAGMSFGGSTSASACQVDRRCRAAVDLDGLEFDRTLYDARFRTPLLLIQSDWRRYPNLGPADPDFTFYDYAYERWSDAGSTPDIYRFRIAGIRHIGFTDLALAPRDAVRDGIFGVGEGAAVVDATDDLVIAFLDRYVAGRRGDVDATAARHPGVERHFARPHPRP